MVFGFLQGLAIVGSNSAKDCIELMIGIIIYFVKNNNIVFRIVKIMLQLPLPKLEITEEELLKKLFKIIQLMESETL